MRAVTRKASLLRPPSFRMQRIQRMQEVIGHCGMEDKQCMRELLGQARVVRSCAAACSSAHRWARRVVCRLTARAQCNLRTLGA